MDLPIFMISPGFNLDMIATIYTLDWSPFFFGVAAEFFMKHERWYFWYRQSIEPALIVLDEAVRELDVSTQTQVLQLPKEINKKRNWTWRLDNFSGTIPW